MAMHIKIQENDSKNNTDYFLTILQERRIVSKNILTALQEEAQQFHQTLFNYVMQNQSIDAGMIQKQCAEYFQLPMIELKQSQVSQFLIKRELFQRIKNYCLLPLFYNQQMIIVICNPNDIEIAKNIAFQLNKSIPIYFARYDQLYTLINTYHNYFYDVTTATQDETTVQAITHHLLSDAIHRHASDIHIEPYQKKLRVRFRIDGLLYEITRFPSNLSETLISCFKVLAQLDISIKRTPQDGRLTFHSYLGFIKDCRISTCPIQHGEKLVIRLLDIHSHLRSIDELGLNETDKKIILQITQQPQGLILITGPTGSGKTITLYTLLETLNQTHRNIATIEDPIEIQIEGINQTHVNTKTGLSFSTALRTLLRQDPDVIMIGEIRDQETAELAIRAAQTGHLVISTLHTNNAAEAMIRLQHMNIAPFQLSAALTLIIAQRLVRKLCDQCKTAKAISNSILFDAGFGEPYIDNTTLYTANGCAYCTQGYTGRTGIFELLPVNADIKNLLLTHASHIAIAKQNAINKHDNLWKAGLQRVREGITSLDELYRMIPKETQHYGAQH